MAEDQKHIITEVELTTKKKYGPYEVKPRPIGSPWEPTEVEWEKIKGYTTHCVGCGNWHPNNYYAIASLRSLAAQKVTGKPTPPSPGYCRMGHPMGYGFDKPWM